MSWTAEHTFAANFLRHTRKETSKDNSPSHWTIWYVIYGSYLMEGEAIEQAHAAVFLASDESSYVTATVSH